MKKVTVYIFMKQRVLRIKNIGDSVNDNARWRQKLIKTFYFCIKLKLWWRRFSLFEGIKDRRLIYL